MRGQFPGHGASGPAVGQRWCSNQPPCFCGRDHGRAQLYGRLYCAVHRRSTFDTAVCLCDAKAGLCTAQRSDNRAGIWLCDNEHAIHWLCDNEHASQWLRDTKLSIEQWICDPKPRNQDQKRHAPSCLRDQWPGHWASGPAAGQRPFSNQAPYLGGPDHSRAEPNGRLHRTNAEAQPPIHTCDDSSCKCKLAVVWPIFANHCHWPITSSDGIRRAAAT